MSYDSFIDMVALIARDLTSALDDVHAILGNPDAYYEQHSRNLDRLIDRLFRAKEHARLAVEFGREDRT